MMTPTNPTATAVQRQGPTDSYKTTTARIGINSDEVNSRAVVSANGISEKARKVTTRLTVPRTARMPTR